MPELHSWEWGRAVGDNRAQAAAIEAISSPLLEETSISGAVGMIVNITSPPNFTMHELDETMKVIVEASEDAQPIFGLVYKDELELNDEVLVTVIATGFDPPADTGIMRNSASRYNPKTGGYSPQGGQPNPMLQGSRVRSTEERTQPSTSRPPWDRQSQGRGKRSCTKSFQSENTS